MSTLLKRYDILWQCGNIEEDREGDFVFAQDAYYKIAVLEAKIRVLETQLKDIKRERNNERI
jgi:hypothetical protein